MAQHKDELDPKKLAEQREKKNPQNVPDLARMRAMKGEEAHPQVSTDGGDTSPKAPHSAQAAPAGGGTANAPTSGTTSSDAGSTSGRA